MDVIFFHMHSKPFNEVSAFAYTETLYSTKVTKVEYGQRECFPDLNIVVNPNWGSDSNKVIVVGKYENLLHHDQ